MSHTGGSQFLGGTTLLKGRKRERRGCLCIPDRTEGMSAAPVTRLLKSDSITHRLAHRPLKKPETKHLHRSIIITIINVSTIYVSWFCVRFFHES